MWAWRGPKAQTEVLLLLVRASLTGHYDQQLGPRCELKVERRDTMFNVWVAMGHLGRLFQCEGHGFC